MIDYRYTLERDVTHLAGMFDAPLKGTLLFIMLNPSTTDEVTNDPTIRRCMDLTCRFGFARMLVGNLFAARATKPKLLAGMHDPVGPDNDDWLRRHVGEADMIVAAWGAHKFAKDRAEHVSRLVTTHWHRNLHALTLTQEGHPQHPLHLPQLTKPVLYRRAA